MLFEQCGVHPEILSGIQAAGFIRCTEVQEQTFRHTLIGNDVAVQSQTGTGKSAAFLISILHLFSSQSRFDDRIALIIAPTRELVTQIEQEAKILSSATTFQTAAIIGGVEYRPQLQALKQAKIIVGTPGRLIDLANSKAYRLSDVAILVIDEADRMFDMGFYPDIRRILHSVLPRKQRVTMLFSATLGLRARNLAWQSMNNPIEISINPEQVAVESVTQSLYHLSKDEKLSFLIGYLRRHNPTSTIIFANTKRAVELISRTLNANGFSSQFIIGDLSQKKRLDVINKLKKGISSILVATDIAARGLHINDLELVVNYDLPEDAENYVHRIGRTGRIGKQGVAISLACERFVYGLEAIERYISAKIKLAKVESDMLVKVRKASSHSKNAMNSSNQDSTASQKSSHNRKNRPKANNSPVAHDQSPVIDNKQKKSPRIFSATPTDISSDNNVRKPTREQPPSKRVVGKHSTVQKENNTGKKNNLDTKIAASNLPSQKRNDESRLEYYRRKYGEKFIAVSSSKIDNQRAKNKTPREDGSALSQSKDSLKEYPAPISSIRSPTPTNIIKRIVDFIPRIFSKKRIK